jgi:hypothetical protein
MPVIRKVEDMRVHRYFGSLLLMAAMVVPVAVGASALSAGARGDDRDDHRVHRYYDRHHRDYHEWNEHESRAYVRWETANHRRHREFVRRRQAERARYWNWRHRHGDND